MIRVQMNDKAVFSLKTYSTIPIGSNIHPTWNVIRVDGRYDLTMSKTRQYFIAGHYKSLRLNAYVDRIKRSYNSLIKWAASIYKWFSCHPVILYHIIPTILMAIIIRGHSRRSHIWRRFYLYGHNFYILLWIDCVHYG